MADIKISKDSEMVEIPIDKDLSSLWRDVAGKITQEYRDYREYILSLSKEEIYGCKYQCLYAEEICLFFGSNSNRFYFDKNQLKGLLNEQNTLGTLIDNCMEDEDLIYPQVADIIKSHSAERGNKIIEQAAEQTPSKHAKAKQKEDEWEM